MMHNHRMHWRASSAAKVIVIAALTIAYLTIFAGLIGFVSARMVSLVTLGGTFIGCLAAVAYFVTAMQDVRRGAHH